MAPRHKLLLYNPTTGAQTAYIASDELRRLTIRHRLNAPGSIVVGLDQVNPKVQLFTLDTIVEDYRYDLEAGIDEYVEKVALFRTPVLQTNNEGYDSYSAFCTGLLDLVRRRVVAYTAGSSYATKNTSGNQAIYEYVYENAGAGANNVLRKYNGVTAGLSVVGGSGTSSNWVGGRAWKNLLETIRGIGQQTGVDFDLVRVGNTGLTFQFETYPGGFGTDLSLTGVGDSKVIFSMGFGNMGQPLYSFNRSEEVTVAIILGPGEAENRVVRVRTNVDALAASPWNSVEVTKNATQETTTAGLDSVGDELLDDKQARESFSFQPIQTKGYKYGKGANAQYWLGDKITARYGGIERDKRIIGVDIEWMGGDKPYENITVYLGDVR